mgnify:CR=1 FL=1
MLPWSRFCNVTETFNTHVHISHLDSKMHVFAIYVFSCLQGCTKLLFSCKRSLRPKDVYMLHQSCFNNML